MPIGGAVVVLAAALVDVMMVDVPRAAVLLFDHLGGADQQSVRHRQT
jgi:hypothetical protein